MNVVLKIWSRFRMLEYKKKLQKSQNENRKGFPISKLRTHFMGQFARIHTSSAINNEKILNRPNTKFYNSDGVNVIAAELPFYKKTMSTDVNKVLKTKC